MAACSVYVDRVVSLDLCAVGRSELLLRWTCRLWSSLWILGWWVVESLDWIHQRFPT